MVGFTARMALGAVGFSLAILSSGCASREGPAISNSASLFASSNAIAPAAATDAAKPTASSTRPSPLPAVSIEPEDFRCLDGSWLRVSYSESRDIVRVSLNGATPVAMRRVDEDGLTAYRATSLVFRRSGPRVALVSEAPAVTVRRGETLGLIAVRIYGERTRALDIARLNNIENPDLIFPGQVLRLPQVERRCRRPQHQAASFAIDGTDGLDQPRPLGRRLFSPPSSRQPDQRRVRATASDPPLR